MSPSIRAAVWKRAGLRHIAIRFSLPIASSTIASPTYLAPCLRTATEALCNATLPYISKIAESGVAEAMRQDPVRAKGLNTHEGEVTHEALARDLGLPVKTFPSQS